MIFVYLYIFIFLYADKAHERSLYSCAFICVHDFAFLRWLFGYNSAVGLILFFVEAVNSMRGRGRRRHWDEDSEDDDDGEEEEENEEESEEEEYGNVNEEESEEEEDDDSDEDRGRRPTDRDRLIDDKDESESRVLKRVPKHNPIVRLDKWARSVAAAAARQCAPETNCARSRRGNTSTPECVGRRWSRR